jgi:hypothetical protein
MTQNKYLIAQVVAKVMQFDTASQNKIKEISQLM